MSGQCIEHNFPVYMKKIIIESHIPFVTDQFDGIAEVVRLAPEDITPAAVADADAMIVRTRTRCDASLLEGSKVGFIATATIGTDHIDLDYCRRKGIRVVFAPGCNAPAVAQYVWAAVLRLRPDTSGMVMGIVGLGHVGSIVADWGRQLGVKILACDPPRARMQKGWNLMEPLSEGDEPFITLGEICSEADVVTFHTPHTTGGEDATHHMADDRFFDALKRRPIVINAARGPIVDTKAILRASDASRISGMVIDCWEGEPAIDGRLLACSDVATPHIAGYSLEGKRRATDMTVAAALRFFGADTPAGSRNVDMGNVVTVTPELILGSYDPMADTAELRREFTPKRFEQLRNGYNLRHEVGY